MNFLAHFFLGHPDEEHVVGNFLGDFVKGSDFNLYAPKISQGIVMHRMIDDFVDHHPAFLESKRMIFHRYRHYAGVVMDIYFDYFLAKNWKLFSDQPLDEFISGCYQTLERYQSNMPYAAQVALKHMKQGDWLSRYTNYEGLARTFMGMSKYIKRKTGMETAVEDLLLHEEAMNAHFLEFFPEMITKRDDFLQNSQG